MIKVYVANPGEPVFDVGTLTITLRRVASGHQPGEAQSSVPGNLCNQGHTPLKQSHACRDSANPKVLPRKDENRASWLMPMDKIENLYHGGHRDIQEQKVSAKLAIT